MRIVETKLYTFDELSEEAKETARNWWREASSGDSWAFDNVVEDAQQIGLTINTLSDRRANAGKFAHSAPECAESIVSNHGEMCETYKTAKAYLANLGELDAKYNGERYDENDNLMEEGCEAYDDAREELDKGFLHALLEDYRVMLDKRYEYESSDEYIDETIIANEYEFTEDGKRA